MSDISLSGLYDEKLSLMKEMLRVTSIVSIEGTDPKEYDNEAEDYVALMDKRGKFLKKILLIDEKIQSCDDSGGSELISAAKEEIKETAGRILELDIKHAEISEALMGFIKKNIRDINNGKNMNNIYQQYDYQDSTLFDLKK